MSYDRVPTSFMDNAFLAPNNFNDPQNPNHGVYVNLQLRSDLYFTTLQQISNVQFALIGKGDQQYIKVQKMTDCQGQIPWFGQWAHDYKVDKGKSIKLQNGAKIDMLSCQDWHVAYHRGERVKKSKYRVHVLQTSTDIFKTQIFPENIYKTLKDLLIN